jgi:hypothetical protein
MKPYSTRRNFLKKSAGVALAAPLVKSLEEYALARQAQPPAGQAPAAQPGEPMPMGTIGKVKISRLICGGNLIGGYAHSRDLIYVSSLLKHYFTEDKVMETWALCEKQGINTMVHHPANAEATALYTKYRARGGKIQYLAQIGPGKNDLVIDVKQAKEAGAVGAFLLGNVSDTWTREGDVKLIGELLSIIRQHGMIAGVAAHELRTVAAVEKAGFAPDFYMKTLHDTNYWSHRRPDQMKEVIDNYGIDNYWCMDPKETIAYMSELRRPWIAYKVLAAGAITPQAGFRYAFENGADFINVGMFDFQVAEDVNIAAATFKAAGNREREWFA